MTEIEELVEAIILQAIDDYIWARDLLKTGRPRYLKLKDKKRKTSAELDFVNRYKLAERSIPECTEFFRSEWYRKMTDVDGETVLEVCKTLPRNKFKERIGRKR